MERQTHIEIPTSTTSAPHREVLETVTGVNNDQAVRALPLDFTPPQDRDSEVPLPGLHPTTVEDAYLTITGEYGKLPSEFQAAYEDALNNGDLYTAVIVVDRWRFSQEKRCVQVEEQEWHRQGYNETVCKRRKRLYIHPDDLSDLIKDE